jgi:hypothetical protein
MHLHSPLLTTAAMPSPFAVIDVPRSHVRPPAEIAMMHIGIFMAASRAVNACECCLAE